MVLKDQGGLRDAGRWLDDDACVEDPAMLVEGWLDEEEPIVSGEVWIPLLDSIDGDKTDLY